MTALRHPLSATVTAAWIPAAHSHGVRRKPVAVTVNGEELVLFRDAGGVVRALEDRCCHRRAPLSLGKVRADGALQCGYHGWCYDGAGQCVAIPQLRPGEPVPARFVVRAYTVAEAAGLVWVGGDPAAGPPVLPESASVKGLPGRLGRGRYSSDLAPSAWTAKAARRLGGRARVHEPTGTVTVEVGAARLILAPAPTPEGGSRVWWVAGLA
jgi:phenylpropionate dioxygenase-like ring-hydroxylating dioxygenase large terminal subunit